MAAIAKLLWSALLIAGAALGGMLVFNAGDLGYLIHGGLFLAFCIVGQPRPLFDRLGGSNRRAHLCGPPG